MKIGMQERYRVVVPDRYLKTRFVEEPISLWYGETLILATDMGLQLLEGERAAVTYVPIADVAGAELIPTNTRYQCRWKGEAVFYDVKLPDGTVVSNGAWAYPSAPVELTHLRSQVSFDPTRFTEFLAISGATS